MFALIERRPGSPIPLEVRREMAEFLHAAGVRPGCSTGLGDELTRGYGQLDDNGYWEYPLEAE